MIRLKWIDYKNGSEAGLFDNWILITVRFREGGWSIEVTAYGLKILHKDGKLHQPGNKKEYAIFNKMDAAKLEAERIVNEFIKSEEIMDD